MWQYIYLVAHLNEKDETSRNGLEAHLFNLVTNKNNKWFPFSKVCSLSTAARIFTVTDIVEFLR
jgi:hypothetical protein